MLYSSCPRLMAAFRVGLVTCLAACLWVPFAASQVQSSGEPAPIVKVINFTADWCPNCQVLDPRLDEALSRFEPGEIQKVDLDLTASQSDDPAMRQAAFRAATERAAEHDVAYLWDWYGGVTGLAVFVAADNGEPLSCADRSLTVDEIAQRLREAMVLSLRAPAGSRKPDGPDCPPPEQ